MSSTTPAEAIRSRSLDRPKASTYAITATLAAIVPLAVHWLPTHSPIGWGAILLPAFWISFAAVYLYGFALGLVAVLATLTATFVGGLVPSATLYPALGAELFLFVVCAGALTKRGRGWWTAPLAFAGAKLGSLLIVWTVGGFVAPAAMPAEYLRALGIAWPGLLILLVLNAGLMLRYPKSED